MPTLCSDQPSTSFAVQFAGQYDTKSSQNENLQVAVENGIRKRFIRKPSRTFSDKLDVLSNRVVISSEDGTEIISAPLHSIASISTDQFPSEEDVSTACHMVGLYFGTARRDEMRMSVLLLYAASESEAHSLCSSMNELWMKSYSEYINSFLSIKSEPCDLPAGSRKREFSVVSSEAFEIASSGRGSPFPEDNTLEHARQLMKVVADSLPKRKRGTFIQIMKKLSCGEEVVLLAMLKLIELFGNHKDKVAEFECIVPQQDLERFYQILMMHNIKPLGTSNAGAERPQKTEKPIPKPRESLQKRVLQ